jgi:hypothetical protein
MVYRRGGKWWFKFRFAGRLFREAAKTASKKLARDAERKRRLQLEEGYHGLKKRQVPQTLKAAAAAWLEMKQPTIAPKDAPNREDTPLAHPACAWAEVHLGRRTGRHQPLSTAPTT